MIRMKAVTFAQAIIEKVKFEDVAKVVDATAKLAVLADKHAGKVVPVARAIAKALGRGTASPAVPTVDVLPDAAFDLTAMPAIPDATAWDAFGGIDYGCVDALAWCW